MEGAFALGTYWVGVLAWTQREEVEGDYRAGIPPTLLYICT